MSTTFATDLVDALEATGPRPALAWYGEAARIELSGHVLANWVIKAIGHLVDEVDLQPGDTVVLDLEPHWKRLVIALAAWSLGAEVTTVRDGGTDGAGQVPRVVVTDRPDSDLAAGAEEVLALAPVSLSPRFDGELPALAHDWVAEVRASPDRLMHTLPDWSGPLPHTAECSGAGTDEGAAVPRLLVSGDGLETIGRVLEALLAGGGIIGPAAAVPPDQAEAEGVSERG